MIKNVTKGTVLAREYTICSSLLSRIRGLMFARKPRALVMEFHREQIIGIHMMFVFFPIDVLWLDKDKKVVAVREKLKPWAMAQPQQKARYVIEVPVGMIAKSGTVNGDCFSW